MKILLNAAQDSLMQFVSVIESIENLPESKITEFYIENSAGRHIRHVIDHFLAFFKSQNSGVLNYNLRNRESDIEKNHNLAKKKIIEVINDLEKIVEDNNDLTIISEIDTFDSVDFTFKSNCSRELLYLVNHSIHHAAYIKLLAVQSKIEVSDKIGIAPATASYIRQA